MPLFRCPACRCEFPRTERTKYVASYCSLKDKKVRLVRVKTK